MVRLAFALVLVSCSSSAPSSPVGNEAADPRGTWACFARDPKEPELPQGNVTLTRQRYAAGILQSESVHIQHGRPGATRLVFRPVGGRLESVFNDVTVVATLLSPDASHWTLTYADPASGLEFAEESAIDAQGLTVTSTDPSPEGPVRTSVKFVPTACSTIEAELAKYPS